MPRILVVVDLYDTEFTSAVDGPLSTVDSTGRCNRLMEALGRNASIKAARHTRSDGGRFLQTASYWLNTCERKLVERIPVVEFPMSTCMAGACAGQTTGTINPGVIWINRYGQFGVEAQIPVNRATGTHTGILVQAHIYFDDIFPSSIGKPLF